MKTKHLSSLQRILVAVSAVMLVVVLFVPLWKILLYAPQYPEGLTLKMYPHKLGGDVEIVNGLNHYIGMKTLHTEDFIEFTVLPYIIAFFALFAIIVFLVNRRGLLNVLFYSFLMFGIVAMIDFYRWEYNYGNDLDPTAPIQVPGMSYTPPLIGYKELLNFQAYSWPDVGGILFFGAGLVLMGAVVLSWIDKRKKRI
ncbi:MAG: hypothetical protein H3C36_11195 [Chitinophagaceae bacterium]|nr:hypothetical protein [Chitinophagaceae bacterium]MCZ2395608.1 hypothetical protein [Chitinophagales bacterium]